MKSSIKILFEEFSSWFCTLGLGLSQVFEIYLVYLDFTLSVAPPLSSTRELSYYKSTVSKRGLTLGSLSLEAVRSLRLILTLASK